jgi:NADH-quinone oxidoreductase subunit M
MLWMFQRVNYGPVTNEKNAHLPDLQPREWAVIVPILAVAILMGVLPNLFLKPIEPSVERLVRQVHQGQSSPARIQAGLGEPATSAEQRATSLEQRATSTEQRATSTEQQK